MARAKSRAANGLRSPKPSPTPMKCTGRPNLAAMATRMPPRAVPSSLVMTRPVTPAILPKISTWLSAFWPTVASSTSRTEIGNGDENAATRGAVELGHDQAGDAGDLAENLDLVERILADGGIEHQQNRDRQWRRECRHARCRRAWS